MSNVQGAAEHSAAGESRERHFSWCSHVSGARAYAGEDFVGNPKLATGVYHDGPNGRVVGVADVGEQVMHHLQPSQPPSLNLQISHCCRHCFLSPAPQAAMPGRSSRDSRWQPCVYRPQG